MILISCHTLYPVDADPIPGGGVLVDGTQIRALGPGAELARQFPEAQRLDYPDCVILPGLVNAHSHFDLSDLQGQVSYRGDFIDWIFQIGQNRLKLAANPEKKAQIIAKNVDFACRASLAAGVTTVGDIGFRNQSLPHLARSPIRKTCFGEIIGGAPEVNKWHGRIEKWVDDFRFSIFDFGLQNSHESRVASHESEENSIDFDSRLETRDSRLIKSKIQNPLVTAKPGEAGKSKIRLGLSPHAPYSTAGELYQLAAQVAAAQGLAITTHLAECPMEFDLLENAAGPGVDYLKFWGRWEQFRCPRQRPLAWLAGMDLAGQKFLLAHVNYADEAEIASLARLGHSVVYCPRSHDFFRHPPHPFRSMLAAGINVCLGTDSLASNSSLSILDEMSYIHRACPGLPPDTLLRMATLNGATALGWGGLAGTITPGKQADLIALPTSGSSPNPLLDILQSPPAPRLVMIAGRPVND